jgi:hypothetical protein
LSQAVIDFREVRLRSNALFRLIPYDRLQAQEPNAFKSLGEDPDFFGVLVPPDGSVRPVKSVSRDAALLFLALAEPACLPHLLTSLFGPGANDSLRRLVLDGVFEVELRGQFVSGASVPELLSDQPGAHPASRIAQLSSDAIAYAAALESLATHEVADRLYRFNAAPSTPALQRRFAADDRLLAFVLETKGIAHRLQSRWRRATIGETWLTWSSGESDGPPAYKLYVSPALDHLPRIFEIAVGAFAKVPCTHFKLGRGVFGVLRPDKLVAHFSGLDRLQQAADLIRTAVGGATAQGVPFTAPIDTEGLLSWGMDPPRFKQVLARQEYQSWRQWLTGRIAVYALAAKATGTDVQAFVRTRIALDGIDPQSWHPDLAIWRGPEAG